MHIQRPFRRQWPEDVMAQIIQHMDRKELLTCSLTSRQQNDEVNRVLWRTAHLAFDSKTHTLVPAAKAIRRDVNRKRHIRTLVIAPKRVLGLNRSSGDEWRKAHVQTMYVPEEIPLWTWKLVAAVIRDIPHLHHLEIRDAPASWKGQVPWAVPILERLLELSVTSPLLELRSFTTTLPFQFEISLICARCPRLEKITLHRTYEARRDTDLTSVPQLPPTAFQRLRHVTAPIDFVFMTAPGHPITEVQTNMGVLKASELRNTLLKSSEDIQSLHISSIFSSAHPIAPSLTRLAPLPIVILRTKYMLSSSSSSTSSPSGPGREHDLWGPSMGRALGLFPALQLFECDITMQARMSAEEVGAHVAETHERVKAWAKGSKSLLQLRFAFKHGSSQVLAHFVREAGGDWRRAEALVL